MIKKLALGVLAAAFTMGMVAALRSFNPSPNAESVPEPMQLDEERIEGLVRIGYSHDDGTIIFYRADIFLEFEKAGVEVELMTRFSGSDDYLTVPGITPEKNPKKFGKPPGDDLIEMVLNGAFQGATVNEPDFIQAVRNKAPIVAVAELGPGSLLAFHQDYVKNYPTLVQKVVLAYMRRVQIEWAMPATAGYDRLKLPKHKQIPEVRIPGEEPDLTPHIDNSFVDRAAVDLY